MCIALILWRSALRLLMGKSSIFDGYLPAIHPYFTFRTIASKSQWIFTKFDTCMCIDIVEICLGIAYGQILSIFDRVICPRHDNGGIFLFHILLNLVNL